MSHRAAAPLAAVAGQAFRRPAGAATSSAFGVSWQVPLAPVVHVARLASGAVGSVLPAVGRREVHTFSVDKVFAYCNKYTQWLFTDLYTTDIYARAQNTDRTRATKNDLPDSRDKGSIAIRCRKICKYWDLATDIECVVYQYCRFVIPAILGNPSVYGVRQDQTIYDFWVDVTIWLFN